MKFWSKREGRWLVIFVTGNTLIKNEYGEINGYLYNLRRTNSHKRIRLCWKHLEKYRTNINTPYEMRPKELKDFTGPFEVWWNR